MNVPLLLEFMSQHNFSSKTRKTRKDLVSVVIEEIAFLIVNYKIQDQENTILQ
jgi:hypothetical protein